MAAGEVMQLPKAGERTKKGGGGGRGAGMELADTGREGGHVCKSHTYLCLSHMRQRDGIGKCTSGARTRTHTCKGSWKLRSGCKVRKRRSERCVLITPARQSLCPAASASA